MQRRRTSLIESISNTAVGFGISLTLWTWVIVPVWNLPVSMHDNLVITGLFTVVSIARGYVLRRFYNWMTMRAAVRAATRGKPV